MRKKFFLTLIVLTLVVSMLVTGCTPKQEDNVDVGKEPEKVEDATPETEKIFRTLSVMAASTINPHIASTSYDDEICSLVNATLYGYEAGADRNSAVLAPMLAADEPKQMDEDGKVWQIAIDPDAKWSNGESITADTFVYSFKMALDPVLLNPPAISLAKNYIEIENGEEYYTQLADDKEVAWEDVGIKKVDDLTLEITTKYSYSDQDVMRHFTPRVTQPVYEEMYEALMNDSKTGTTYGTDKDKALFAGPFVLDEWIKGSERVFSKNPEFLHADKIKLDGVNYRIVNDPGTQLQMFENDELDLIDLSAEGYLKYEEDPRVVVYPSRVIRQVEINRGSTEKPILGNLDFRQALYFAQDRATMAELGKQAPAPYYVSTNSVAYADGTKFRELPGANEYVPANNGYDPDKAVELFNKAMEAEGLDKISLTLNYYDSREDVKMMAEYQQKSLQELFGPDRFELKLQALPSNQLFDTMKSFRENPSAYDLSWGAWSWSATDFSPNRAFEVFQSDYGRANAPYGNKELDRLYLESTSEEVRLDEVKRAEYAMEMEKLYIEDVLALPIFEVINKSIFSDRMVLPVDTYQSGLGWGIKYFDIAE